MIFSEAATEDILETRINSVGHISKTILNWLIKVAPFSSKTHSRDKTELTLQQREKYRKTKIAQSKIK